MAKPPPDIKGGRMFWLGDYDECIAITGYNTTANSSSGESSFKGRYCTAIMPLQITDLHVSCQKKPKKNQKKKKTH